MRKPRTVTMTVATVVATATLSLGGVALAATGTLPGAADDEATTKAGVELTIPGPAVASDGHADERGRSVEQTGDETAATDTDDGSDTDVDATDPEADGATEDGDETEAADQQARPTDTHGYEVSQLATTTTLTGREKGAAISSQARTNAPAGDEAEATDVAAQVTPRRSPTGEQAARAEHAGTEAR